MTADFVFDHKFIVISMMFSSNKNFQLVIMYQVRINPFIKETILIYLTIDAFNKKSLKGEKYLSFNLEILMRF